LRGGVAKNPRSSQTGGNYCDRPLTAAPAASFNPKNEIASFRAFSSRILAISKTLAEKKRLSISRLGVVHRRLINLLCFQHNDGAFCHIWEHAQEGTFHEKEKAPEGRNRGQACASG